MQHPLIDRWEGLAAVRHSYDPRVAAMSPENRAEAIARFRTSFRDTVRFTYGRDGREVTLERARQAVEEKLTPRTLSNESGTYITNVLSTRDLVSNLIGKPTTAKSHAHAGVLRDIRDADIVAARTALGVTSPEPAFTVYDISQAAVDSVGLSSITEAVLAELGTISALDTPLSPMSQRIVAIH